MGHYIGIWDSHQSCIRLKIEPDICAVPMVDAIATGEVDCNDFLL